MTVIGPFKQSDWSTMSCLCSSLSLLRSRNQKGKFDRAIKMEGELYEEYKAKYFGGKDEVPSR